MIRKSGPSYSYFELLDACQKQACPLCTLGNASARRNLKTLIFEGVNDYGLRAKLRESMGYCHEHTWLLPESGESAPLGIAILHRDLLNTVRKQLDDSEFDKTQGKRLRSFVADVISQDETPSSDARSARYIQTKAPCPACRDRDKIEKLALKSLIDALNKEDADMLAALESSDGLCLPHLRRALEAARNEQVFATLVNITNAQLSGLIQELDEFIRKNDYRFRDEKITERERGSWRRALDRLVGPK